LRATTANTYTIVFHTRLTENVPTGRSVAGSSIFDAFVTDATFAIGIVRIIGIYIEKFWWIINTGEIDDLVKDGCWLTHFKKSVRC